jgi:hypothetical protein
MSHKKGRTLVLAVEVGVAANDQGEAQPHHLEIGRHGGYCGWRNGERFARGEPQRWLPFGKGGNVNLLGVYRYKYRYLRFRDI